MQGPAVFMDLPLEEQAQELRAYLRGLGAEISEEKSAKGIEDDLHKIVGAVEACFREGHEAEVEEVLNDIVSMTVLVEAERAEGLILALCEKLSRAREIAGQPMSSVALKALWLLFQSLDVRSPMRYHVYYSVVQVARQGGQVKAVYNSVDTLKAQFSQCPPSAEQLQKLYRLLHEVLTAEGESGPAAKVMLELLATYTAENASYARDDAIRCIIAALDDPGTFLLDPLLALKPVRVLEGELIHDLLTIFVSEQLSSYVRFYREHKEFVQSLGLSHDRNMKKMRLLTFMQLAESQPEMSFETVACELQLEAHQVEPFIIEVLKTRMVRARMDQAAKKIYTSSTMHRTFERAQWQQLRDLLHAWKHTLQSVHDGMAGVAAASLEMHHH